MNQQIVSNTSEDPIQREIEKLDAANRKREEKIRNLETRTAQNVNLYFIFQAVILASTNMASAPKCHQWWTPFIVSLLAAVLNLFNYCSVMFKVLKEREELDQTQADVAFIKLNGITWAQVNEVLPGAILNRHGKETVRPKASSLKRWKGRLQVCASIAVFVVFTAVIMSGCYSILCRSGDHSCVKLC